MEHLLSENGSNTDLFRIPTGDVFHTVPFYGTSSIRKRIRTPIYSGYLPETFSTRRLHTIKHPATNYKYILITIFMITFFILASPREQEYYKRVLVVTSHIIQKNS